MFDRLEDIVKHYEELMFELNNPSVAEDQKRFRKLMKEQSDLTPLVETYKEYKQAKQDVEDSLALLEEESDEEMREMAKEELSDAKKRIEELEQQLKILLLPKDPNDDKNVIVEIRAGAGGDEAALFASELYRMYVHYAERQRWKVELINVSESGIGGMKEVEFMITGQGFTWLDTGTHESLVEATNFVKTVETHEHRKIACLEEIAYTNGWITRDEVMEAYEILKKNQHGQYLKDVVDGKYIDKLPGHADR